ncbi:hypothetical protein Q5P01_008247 [Channa striata]|uniref:Pancreatic progenitor cell differentiation and proliferation factor B n=1 Tax=Channa striata TaxID=64152 RepID=A0AA88NDP4_CHASR|nr:hypothetical protein Q5P01_008247 [Channa striata]
MAELPPSCSDHTCVRTSGHQKVSIQHSLPQPTEKMAAIPAGGSLVATTDYYRRRIGSTSSSSSCGSSEYSGEVIPHHPGLPKQDSGHWWSSFFFGKQPGMTPLTEEAQQKAGVPGAVTNGQITCVAREMVMQRQVSESSDTGNPTSH